MDERILEKWFRMEAGNLNAALVRAPRPLADLLLEERPTAPTKAGEHAFDPDALRRLADALPPLVRARLRVPLLVYRETETPDEAYVLDAVAAKALKVLGVAVARPREGKLWVSYGLLVEFARRYPTCLQTVLL